MGRVQNQEIFLQKCHALKKKKKKKENFFKTVSLYSKHCKDKTNY